MTTIEAIREEVLGLMCERGLVEPEIKHEIEISKGVILFCVSGRDAKRDWLVAA